MSSGGVFKLIANQGVQDKLLMASDYLNYRIKFITSKNRKRAKLYAPGGNIDLTDSWIPDMKMIGKTHVVFVSNSYKPFVASGFEYNKTQAAGIIDFDSSIKFSVPTFGDFINDMVVHVRMTGLKAVSPADRVRYVSFLGHKLFKKVAFTINNNPLDAYYSDDYNSYFQFHVNAGKRIGWLRNMGQEVPHVAYLTADPSFDLHREVRFFGDGNQTLKQSHDSVDLWIPLLFWFKDVRCSLPNAVIPYGQTDVSIQLASVSELVGFADYGGGGEYVNPTIQLMDLYMNNIFMNPDIVNLFMKKFGFSLIRVHGHHTQQLSNKSNNVLLNQLKWPAETLYTAFRPVENATYSQYWHKTGVLTPTDVKVPVAAQNQALTTVGNVSVVVAPTSTTAQLVQTSGPALSLVDDAYNGYTFVITGGLSYSPSDPTLNRYTVTDYVGATQVITVNRAWTSAAVNATTTYELFTPQVAINVARYYKETPSIDTIRLKAHGIDLYKNTSESFYNSYLPYRFGKMMNTPISRGWYMINFNFLTGEHQPSGHVNLSRMREFYLGYTSSYISPTNKVNLIVNADLINFLLVKDGSAVLRYST